MHTNKHRLCNLGHFIVQILVTGKTEIYPAAYTAVTTLGILDSGNYNTNHQVFSILTMPFTKETLQFCFALLKWMEIVIANCFLWNCLVSLQATYIRSSIHGLWRTLKVPM